MLGDSLLGADRRVDQAVDPLRKFDGREVVRVFFRDVERVQIVQVRNGRQFLAEKRDADEHATERVSVRVFVFRVAVDRDLR